MNTFYISIGAESNTVQAIAAIQPNTSVGILCNRECRLLNECLQLLSGIMRQYGLHGCQVDNIRSPFRYNPKPLKVVFMDFAYEVALEPAMWGSRSEVDEFITVVSG